MACINHAVGIQITVLGSGSAGNCTLIETEQTSVLVDAGLSNRQIVQRLEMIGRNITDIDAILLTHEHSDHTRALSVICKTRPVPVYANRLTAEALTSGSEWNKKVNVSWRLFTTGSPFTVGDISVDSFSVPHDAQDPVGFTLRGDDHAVGVLTDLGHATKLVVERTRSMNALVLESNHDLKLLQEDTVRPWATKQRIMSRHGHLSNDAAATLASDVACDRLRHVFLVHLSQDCNRPELAQQVVEQKLRQVGASHVSVAIAGQDRPTQTISL